MEAHFIEGGKLDREERVRERAHTIWEEEGRPQGKHIDHWHRACREIDVEARQAGSSSSVPDAGRTTRGGATGQSASIGNSGLVGTGDADRGPPNAMGVDDLNVTGDLSDPKDNRPSTGRSKLVGT